MINNGGQSLELKDLFNQTDRTELVSLSLTSLGKTTF